MLRPGEPWAVPVDIPANLTVQGSDAVLAAAIAAGPAQPLVRWTPTLATDLGRSIGRAAQTEPHGGLAAPMDAIAIGFGLAVNAVVLGRDPHAVRAFHPMTPVQVVIDGRQRWSGPAHSIVIANGEFLAGNSVAPKSHPGDGRLDVLVFAIPGGQRRTFRARLARGDHLPHPRILMARGEEITVETRRPLPVALDGMSRGRTTELRARCESDRWRLIL